MVSVARKFSFKKEKENITFTCLSFCLSPDTAEKFLFKSSCDVATIAGLI